MELISNLAVPAVLLLVGVVMTFSKQDMMKEFVQSTAEGMKTCVDLLPTLILLLCAVSMFNASGAAEYLSRFVSPVLGRLGIPEELSSLVIVRPVSGGASTAVMESILSKYGADSFVGRCASVVCGSSDTIIYITALYFSAAGVKKTGYALPVAFLSMIFCLSFSCFLCRIFF